MTFSEKIKRYIDAKGLKNRELAKKIGKSETRVSSWVNAERPSIEFLLCMVKAFPDFDLNYMLKENVGYPLLDEIEKKAEEERTGYGKSAVDIIKDIEKNLKLLKEKVAQNSHK